VSGANKVYLNAQLAELAYLQACQEGLGLSAWVNQAVEEKLVQLGKEAHRDAAGADRRPRRHRAPWTPEEVASLNGYQASGAGPRFTCGDNSCREPDRLAGRTVLRAAEDGWRCDSCGYTQDWALTLMTDWSWQQPGPWRHGRREILNQMARD
jgi:hypothetical protein